MKKKIICFLFSVLVLLYILTEACGAETITQSRNLHFTIVPGTLKIIPTDVDYFVTYSRTGPSGARLDYELHCGNTLQTGYTGTHVKGSGSLICAEDGKTYPFTNFIGSIETTRFYIGSASSWDESAVPTDAFNIKGGRTLDSLAPGTRDSTFKGAQAFAMDSPPGVTFTNLFVVTPQGIGSVNKGIFNNNFAWTGDVSGLPGATGPVTFQGDFYPNAIDNFTPMTIEQSVSEATYTAQDKYVPIPNVPPLRITKGSHMLGNDYCQGVTGIWGYTKTNRIPPLGTITRTDLSPGTADPFFSGTDSSGTVTNIGIKTIPIKVKDSSGSADPSADVANTTRTVTATTKDAPSINATINKGALNPQGGSAAATVSYTETGKNQGGGVEGWTNFPITVKCDGSAIRGDYNLWSVWSLPGTGGNFQGSVLDRSSPTPGAGGIPSPITTVFTKPAVGSQGWQVKGYCAAKAAQSNLLSAETPSLELKYDPSAPTADVTFHAETKAFSDSSTDGLSGINPARTSILFRTVGGRAPSESDKDWQLLSNYTTPVAAANYDVYAKAYDKAGNYDIRLAHRNLKVHGAVEASIDTDKGATIHAVGCPNQTSPAKTEGCLADCHDGAALALTEGSTFHYIFTLHDTDATGGAKGTFVDYLPLGVVPIGTGLTDMTSTSGHATVSGTVSKAPEPSGTHAGQYKVSGSYTLAKGGDTLKFKLECRVPLYNPTHGAENILANHGGSAAFTMDDSFQGTADFNSAVHEVKPLPTHGLTLTKTVTGKYGNRDRAFTFRLDMEQSWGVKLDKTCSYSKTGGATGTITIKNGTIEKIDGTPTDSIHLKHGQGITIKDLPEGLRFTITEEPKTGYTATEKVNGADYTPIAVKEGNAPAGSIQTAAAQTGSKQTSPAPTGIIVPKQGRSILPSGMVKAGGLVAAGESWSGAAEKLGDISRGTGSDGVVKGSINTADVKVDYFNDKRELAPPTGIADADGGNGILPLILSGLVVLLGGALLWKRRKSF